MTEAATETPASPAPEAKGSVSKETVTPASKLSDSDIKWRAKYKDTKEELETAKIQADKERKELASKVESTAKERGMIEQKWVEAEMKAEAIAAGLKDLELTKLIDTSTVKVNDGKIEGLKEAIEAFKTRKPEYFGSDKKSSSSSNAGMPNSGGNVATKNAWDMDKKEFQQAKLKLTGGRRG